jgi:hypothetical protein
MITHNYNAGARDACAVFGVKEAGAGTVLKEMLVGKPGQYLQELRNGQLFQRGGLIHKALDPVARDPTQHPLLRGLLTTANAAGMYGVPAYMVAQALSSPKDQRGSTTGSMVGSTVGGILGSPLGIVGTGAGSLLGGSLGEALGRNFNQQNPRPPSET